jgi:hypothetical protein
MSESYIIKFRCNPTWNNALRNDALEKTWAAKPFSHAVDVLLGAELYIQVKVMLPPTHINYRYYGCIWTHFSARYIRICDACKMHTWSLHFTTWYSILFTSYIGYILAFWWLLGIIQMFPNFIGLTWENQKISFSMFLTFRVPNRVQITWNFAGASFSTEQDFGEKEVQQGSHEGQTRWPMRPNSPAAWGLPVSPLLLWWRRSSSRWIRLDLKPTI